MHRGIEACRWCLRQSAKSSNRQTDTMSLWPCMASFGGELSSLRKKRWFRMTGYVACYPLN